MGTYINIGSAGFQRVRNSEYVDKSGLIAMVIELKYDKAVGTAISQIKENHYPEKVADYTGDILLCGISYDREAKTHSCQIEHWTV